MLTVRPAQMKVLEQAALRKFIANMVVHLRTAHPNYTECMSEAGLTSFIRAGVGKAKTFGIRMADNVESFLDFTIIYGLDCFDTTSFQWARKTLESQTMDETEKANRLNEYVVFCPAPLVHRAAS